MASESGDCVEPSTSPSHSKLPRKEDSSDPEDLVIQTDQEANIWSRFPKWNLQETSNGAGDTAAEHVGLSRKIPASRPSSQSQGTSKITSKQSFEERGFGYFQNFVIGTAMTIANEVGIFQALCIAEKQLTSSEVAMSIGLRERFVRELLGCLSTAELIQVSKRDDGALEYSIDDDAKTALKGRLGAYLGFPSVMANIFPSVTDCFYKDKPACVRYTDQLQNVLDRLLKGNAPQLAQLLVEHVPDLHLQTRLEKGIDVFEFGSGRGRLTATLAQQFPSSRFVASEVVPRFVAANKTNWAHVPNLSFSVDDLCSIPESLENRFDWVFCLDVIHDLPDPLAALQGIKRMLRKPDGLLTFIDMATAGSPLLDKGDISVATLYGMGIFFCIPESFQREQSLALGPCSGKETISNLIRKAGFELRVFMVDDHTGLFVCQLPTQG